VEISRPRSVGVFRLAVFDEISGGYNAFDGVMVECMKLVIEGYLAG
jgi:hypothetical protein